MQDEILRAMTTDGWVKAVAINSKNIVERARTIHNTTPTATAALQHSGAAS
jgi:molecular chaperone Hsp33